MPATMPATVIRSTAMLEAQVDGLTLGHIFKPESEPDKFHFGYKASCPAEMAVSLSMPVVRNTPYSRLWAPPC